MFKWVALFVAVLFVTAFYDTYTWNSLSEAEQAKIIEQKQSEERLAKEAESEIAQKNEDLKAQGWSDTPPEKYAEKFIAEGYYLYVFLLIIPAVLFKIQQSFTEPR